MTLLILSAEQMELDEFQESFNFRTIFLEYGSLYIEIKNFPN